MGHDCNIPGLFFTLFSLVFLVMQLIALYAFSQGLLPENTLILVKAGAYYIVFYIISCVSGILLFLLFDRYFV